MQSNSKNDQILTKITITGNLKIAVIGNQRVELILIVLTLVKNFSGLWKPTVNKSSRLKLQTEAGNIFCIPLGSLKTQQNTTKLCLFLYLH